MQGGTGVRGNPDGLMVLIPCGRYRLQVPKHGELFVVQGSISVSTPGEQSCPQAWHLQQASGEGRSVQQQSDSVKRQLSESDNCIRESDGLATRPSPLMESPTELHRSAPVV